MNRIRLLVLNAALGPLDYRLPDGIAAPAGSVVVAPLGPRKVTGIVWDEGRLPGDEIAFERLRPILEVLPVPPLPEALRRLIEWTADYYCAPLAGVALLPRARAGALGIRERVHHVADVALVREAGAAAQRVDEGVQIHAATPLRAAVERVTKPLNTSKHGG